MKASRNKRRGMMRRWGGLRRCLATASAICICATPVGASDARFDYSVRPLKDAAIEGSSVREPIDPARCGAEFGWIETMKTRVAAEAFEMRLPWENPVRVRKGSDVKVFSEIQERYGRSTGQVVQRIPATMTVEYTRCVVPAGLVLLSFEAEISIDAEQSPRHLVVTYDGPSMPLILRSSRIDTTNFKVETDIGGAILTGISLPSSSPFSAEPHKRFSAGLRIQSEGANE